MVSVGLMAMGLAGGGVVAVGTAYGLQVDPPPDGTQVTASGVGVPGTGRLTDPVDPADREHAGAGFPGEGSGLQEVGVEESVDRRITYTGERSTRLRFPNADFVKVRLSRIQLLPGDRVTVANPERSEVHTYRGDPREERFSDDSPVTYDENGDPWALSITGDTAIVTLHASLEADRLDPKARAKLDLGSAGKAKVNSDPGSAAGDLIGDLSGYGVTVKEVAVGRAKDEAPAKPGSEESICGQDNQRDAVCYKSTAPAIYARSRPVARLLVNGRLLCTAWRIGPSNRMITNNHCLSQTGEARSTELWFNYECGTCGVWGLSPVTKVVGSSVLATDAALDYTLFTVDDFNLIRDFGYLTLETRSAVAGEKVYIPQHADGAPKTVGIASDSDSSGQCMIDSPRYAGNFTDSDVSYYCDTSTGSSGSPVLSLETHKVIALHHFGGCPNSGVRSDLLYRAISDKI
ncbi:MAG: trypsin-like serine peptidase [Micromonosporaceae bacterium]